MERNGNLSGVSSMCFEKHRIELRNIHVFIYLLNTYTFISGFYISLYTDIQASLDSCLRTIYITIAVYI